jgi:hypothetical protein
MPTVLEDQELSRFRHSARAQYDRHATRRISFSACCPRFSPRRNNMDDEMIYFAAFIVLMALAVAIAILP